eukprot:superscaffoldBa00000016_g321
MNFSGSAEELALRVEIDKDRLAGIKGSHLAASVSDSPPQTLPVFAPSPRDPNTSTPVTSDASNGRKHVTHVASQSCALR